MSLKVAKLNVAVVFKIHQKDSLTKIVINKIIFIFLPKSKCHVTLLLMGL